MENYFYQIYLALGYKDGHGGYIFISVGLGCNYSKHLVGVVTKLHC